MRRKLNYHRHAGRTERQARSVAALFRPAWRRRCVPSATKFRTRPADAGLDFAAEDGCVFLALHATYGETDSAKQLDFLGVPTRAANAEASRIAFDKVLTKQKCIAAGCRRQEFLTADSRGCPADELSPPVVVKPSRQGLSVGLQFVKRVEDWRPPCRKR